MRLPKATELNNYLISFLVHTILLLILAFITIKPAEKVNAIFLEWLTSEKTPVEEDFAPIGSTGNIERIINSPSGTSRSDMSGERSISEHQSTQSNVGKSIEPPVYNPNAATYSSPTPGNQSSYLSGVKSKLGSGSSGSSGFQLEDDGGNISVLKSVLPDPKISDYGTVKLLFKINRDGTVDAESIVPAILDDPIYTEASIKALAQWRFSVRNYNKSKTYGITFIFKPE